MKGFLLLFLCAITIHCNAQNSATITETTRMLKTYPYSDPSPIPILSDNSKIYPYNKIEKYSHTSVEQPWKIITLENDYIKVWVMPESGGKVWGAVEKSTGKEFIYRNEVMKFRDIAMRGPWTSGGIEFNFGIIGHSPSTASKVDYVIKENNDGSVSCIVGNLDLTSRTHWSVEIRLPADKAFFETNVLWYNPTTLNQSYYNWMTGAAVASQDLEFYCPGNYFIEHSGESKQWPVDNEGRKISVYKNNNFGPDKSYHVVGALENFFGGYYHNSNFGFGQWSPYEEMPGQKLWLWALSRKGGIWEDLLTDTDGQYIEFQAGRLLNQHSGGDHLNPIRQVGFLPNTSDKWEEIWFPVKDIGGMVSSSRFAVLNATKKNDRLSIGINALQNLNDTLYIKIEGTIVSKELLTLKPMEVFTKELPLNSKRDFEIKIGNKKLFYTSKQDSLIIKRPFEIAEDFSLSKRQQLVLDGEDFINFREYNNAYKIYSELLEMDASDKVALLAMAELKYRLGYYDESLDLANIALMQNTYDDQANFLAGMSYRKKDDLVNALESFGWAARGMEYRSAAFGQMAELYIQNSDPKNALKYAQKSLYFNRFNITAAQTKIIAQRLQGMDSGDMIQELLEIDPLNHLADYEAYQWNRSEKSKNHFIGKITNEFSEETYLELALFYHGLGLNEYAKELLTIGPSCVKNNLWLAYLNHNNDPDLSKGLLSKTISNTPDYVFPYRLESLKMLEWVKSQDSSWVIDYLLAINYAGVGREEEALNLLVSLKDQPESWVFYMTRAKMLAKTNKSQQIKDLTKANELAPESWRTWNELILYYLANSEYVIAEDLAKVASKKFSDNYTLSFLYAKSLIKTGSYQQCVKIMEDIDILPFEGANESRRVYEEAHLRLAMEYIDKKKYKTSVKILEESIEWPENIGVGKPFDPEQRKAEYLLAYCYEKLGNNSLKNQRLDNIVDYTTKMISRSQADHILGLMALKYNGKEVDANDLLAKINNDKSFDKDVKLWINDQFNGSANKSSKPKYELLEKIMSYK